MRNIKQTTLISSFLCFMCFIPQIVIGYAISSAVNIDTLRAHDSLDSIQILIQDARKLSNSQSTCQLASAKLDRALEIAREESTELPALYYIGRAEIFLTLRDLKQTEEQIKLADRLISDKSNGYIQSQYNLCLGKFYHYTGSFDKSIKKLSRNIELAREQQLSSILPATYEQLANVYNSLDSIRLVRQNLDLMLKYAFENNDYLSCYRACIRVGFGLRDTDKKYEEANAYFSKALLNAQILKDTLKVVYSMGAIGRSYYLHGMLDSSLFWYHEAMKQAVSINNNSRIGNCYGNIATVYRDKKEYNLATTNYNQGVHYATLAKDWSGLSWMYSEMSEMLASKKEFGEAYKFAVLYKQYDDSSKREAFNQGLIDARIRFQVETKESELQILSLQLENQRLIMYGILGFLGLTIIILLLLYRQFKINEKRRTAELNRKLSEITQANLRQQMNPHFIFNTLNSIQYYMYQNDKISTNNYLTKFSSLIRRILENSQHSAIPLREELEAVELYLELEMIRFKNKFDFEIKVDDDIDPLMYKVPAMIIQPYVENAVCHGLMQKNGKGHLFIEIEHKTNHLSCRIVDNGIGREAAKEFARERNKNHTSLGTKITESRIEINNKLYGTNLKTLYTDLNNDLGEATGTMVEIQIPILT